MQRDRPLKLNLGRAGKLLCVAWLIGLLSLPAVLLALGTRQPVLENKAKTAQTKITLADLTDQVTFNNLETNALEANPVRQFALDLRARVYVDLLGASPNLLASLGEDGFLFTRGEVEGCDDVAKTREGMVSLALISEALRTVGAHTVVFVAGSKLLYEQRHHPRLPKSDIRCEARHEQQIEVALTRIPGGVSIASALRAQLAAGRDVFLKDDTHFNGYGRAAVARVVMHNLLPARNRPVIGVGEPGGTRQGDVARFAGFSRTEHYLNNPSKMPPGHRPLKSSVVYIGDSQVQTPFFAGTVAPGFVATPGAAVCSWILPGMWGGGTYHCQAAISKAHYFVIETVEHHLERIINGCSLPITAAVTSLKGQPVTLSGQRVAQLDANGQVGSVEVGGAPDVSNVDRVIRISTPKPTYVALGQTALRGPPASCASVSTSVGHLSLVVRAGNRISDLRLGLTSLPGQSFTADIVDLKGAVRGL